MLNLNVWGSRGSVPVSGPRTARYGGATTCLEVELIEPAAGTPHRVILDGGTGLSELGRAWSPRPPEAIVLQTHAHWDHIQGYPFFGPFFYPEARFDLWAVDRDGVSFREVLSQQMTRPSFPVGMEIIPAQLEFTRIPETGQARRGELELAWTDLEHPSGDTAFRLSYRGRSIVFSGDAELPLGGKERLVELSRGADLLVIDSQYFPEEYELRRGFGHSTPRDAIEVGIEAEVGRLLLTHHDPTHDDARLDAKLEGARQAAGGAIQIDNAHDRLRIELGAVPPARLPVAGRHAMPDTRCA